MIGNGHQFEYKRKKMRKFVYIVLAWMIGVSVYAFDFRANFGVHDFIVPNIKNDTPHDGIYAGTSHTLGLNTGLSVEHHISKVNIFAKIDVFLDHDKDKLDPDHIPVWFDSLVDIDGLMYQLNSQNSLQWFLLMDNKQNTVSSVERQVRQHVGIGYNYRNGGFSFEGNLYAGFYFLELDDDTPVNRGYVRGRKLDMGEASHMFDIQFNYDMTPKLYMGAQAKMYRANTGSDELENDLEFKMRYKTSAILVDGATMNLHIRYCKYNLDNFYDPDVGRAPLPFESEILVRAYVGIPILE